jgi:predicted amidophosphoribosyltransferase
MRPTFVRNLAEFVVKAVPEADAVIMAPSSRDDAKPYADAILKRLNSSSDLSERLSRTGKVKAADAETTGEMLVQDLTYRGAGDEPGIKSLVIVDETFATGKTVAAMLAVLRANGLPVHEDCKVTVATALKVE